MTGPGASATPGRRRPTPLLVVLPILAVGLALGAGMLLLPPGPEPSRPPASGEPAAIPPPVAPLVVHLRRAGGGPASVGLPVALSSSAIGLQGLAVLELWAGGERVETTPTADPARPAATARWQWTPQAAGETILVARAFDAAGHVTQSAPVRVTVTADPPRSFRLESVAALAGETLATVVARVGGDLPLARYLSPNLGDGPLAAGQVVDVPVFDPVPPITASREGLPDDLAPVAAIAPVLAPGLAEPQLDLAVEDCTVTATASGGGEAVAGFAFAALPPVGDSFVPLPPLAPAGGSGATTSFAALGGMNYVTVAAYSPEATAPSAIVPVEVPPDCGAAGWEGDARLDGGHLIAPASVDRTYLYLRVGTAAWQRVPAAAGSFVEPVDGVVDFGPLLPSIAGQDLGLEAWGWTGGTLVKLGAGTFTAPGQQLYSGGLAYGGDPVLGLGTTLDVVVQKGGGEFEEKLAKHSVVSRPGPTSTSGKRTFKWSTSVPSVTHLAWQVLPYPLDESATSLTPPFLIDSDTIPVQGNSTGYFSLDLKSYLLGGDGSSGVWSTTLLGEQLINQVVQAKPFAPGATAAPGQVDIAPGKLWWPDASGGATSGGPTAPSLATLEDLAYLIPPVTSLFVRVIPFVGTTPVPNASNSVSFDVVEPSDPLYIDTSPPPPPPTYPGAYDFTATFFAPTGSDSKYARCVRVVKGGKVLSPSMQTAVYAIAGGYDWSNTTVHCQPPPDDDDGWSLSDAFDTFAGWVGDVWDYVSEGYSWMQDQVVAAVLAFVPCEQIANQVADNGKEVCTKIAKTALQAALASFGLPPEIPDWESTIAAAKGDLRTFILANAKQFPGVSEACDAAAVAHQAKSDFPTCDALVDKAIEGAVGQIVAERSQAAAANAGVIVPPGVTVEPDPRSMAQPPHFEVTITRTGLAVPPSVVCSMSVSMTSKVTGWTWNEYQWKNGQESVVEKSGDVSGEPFMGTSQVIAPLAQGQTATYELWLTKRVVWFEPDGWNDYYAQQYAEWNGSHNHAWVLLQAGATVTGKLTSSCLSGGQSVQVLKGSAWQ